MQGTWQITTALEAGTPVSQGAATLVIEGARFERRTPAHVFERRIELRGAGDVLELDLHITNEPGRGSVLQGIVTVVKPEMRICHAKPGARRPTSFESTPENGHILSISRRA